MSSDSSLKNKTSLPVIIESIISISSDDFILSALIHFHFNTKKIQKDLSKKLFFVYLHGGIHLFFRLISVCCCYYRIYRILEFRFQIFRCRISLSIYFCNIFVFYYQFSVIFCYNDFNQCYNFCLSDYFDLRKKVGKVTPFKNLFTFSLFLKRALLIVLLERG